MICYDCHTQARATTTAVALCRRCGAALCAHHTQIRPDTLHRIVGMGVSTGPRAARRITCTTCHMAEVGVVTGTIR
ncbi:DUF2180 family protein [Streptomyces sp. NPDC050658]|uniref:DUF2180 family protein n=1 Tax=unclassified Streptomyces TaxID=2593676 RepID=UPI0034218881